MMALEARVGRANMLLPENECVLGGKDENGEGGHERGALEIQWWFHAPGPDKRPAGWQG